MSDECGAVSDERREMGDERGAMSAECGGARLTPKEEEMRDIGGHVRADRTDATGMSSPDAHFAMVVDFDGRHSNTFDIDEDVLPTGVKTLPWLSTDSHAQPEEYLGREGSRPGNDGSIN